MSEAKNALVVRGGWSGHAPVESTDLFLPFLESNGFRVRIEEDPQVYADRSTMESVDLVVQCYTMGEIDRDVALGLRAAVEAGTGIAGWHGGIADSFRKNTWYLQLIGGQFADHPQRDPSERVGKPPDNWVPHTVDIVPDRADHPIVAGLQDFELETEQYWVLTDDYCDVLATTTHSAPSWHPWHREVTCPAVWTREWGKGRVFVATPGHLPDVLRDPNVRTIIERGMLWASR